MHIGRPDSPLVCALWGEREMASFDQAVIENTQNAVLACDENGNLVVFNPTARAWYGFDLRTNPELASADSGCGLFMPDGLTRFSPPDLPLARAFRGETIRDVAASIRAEGQAARHVSCGGGPFFDEDGRQLGAFAVLVDTTEVRKLTLELEELARHDALTGLPNRRAFESEVERVTLVAERAMPSTVLFADVDRFKTCNDRFGHVVGDQVLRQIAKSMEGVVRDVDTVARIGGDEFGIVLWNLTEDAVETIITRLSEAVIEVGREHDLDIGLSIGRAVVRTDSDPSSVLAEADDRMYEMKRRRES